MNERALLDELISHEDSPYRRYLHVFVGEQSLLSFLHYEMVTGILGPLPGALGYFLRKKCYPLLINKVGFGCVFGRSMVVRCPKRISIGNQVLMDDQVVLDAKGSSSLIQIGNRVLIGRYTILSCNEATIHVGDSVSIGPFCSFLSKNYIVIGSNVSIGPGAQLLAGTHASDNPDLPVNQQARIAKGICIEDNVWIGAGAKVLDGVVVGRNSIVGVDAVVSKDVPAWTVVLGNPARVIQKRKSVTETV